MPVNLKFHYFGEKKPKHKESIIFLEPVRSFGFMGFHPVQCDAIYDWEEIDEDGDPTGSTACYKKGDEEEEGWRLRIMLDGTYAEDNWLWTPAQDFFKSVNGESENGESENEECES